jgi:hypothetical protein
MLLKAGEKVKKHTDNVNFEVRRSRRKKDGGGGQEEEEEENKEEAEGGGGEGKNKAKKLGHKGGRSKSESASGKYGDESRESREEVRDGDEVGYGDAVRRRLLPREDEEFNNGYWGRRFRIHVPIVTRPQVITSCI